MSLVLLSLCVGCPLGPSPRIPQEGKSHRVTHASRLLQPETIKVSVQSNWLGQERERDGQGAG